MHEPDFLYALASEPELNDLVSGRIAGSGRPWPYRGLGMRHSPGSIGVLWRETPPDVPVRPLALVVDVTQQRRLFGRFAQVRSDLSPLSAWCYIISSNLFDTLDGLLREPDLGGVEASWAGLVIAEAMVLSDRPVSQLKLAACLATQSYAVARTLALWPVISVSQVLSKYESLQRDIRQGGVHDLGRSNFAPLWATLASLSIGQGPMSGPYEHLAYAALSLKRAREVGEDEISVLASIFDHIPEATFLSKLTAASPEDRLKAFDMLVRKIDEEDSSSVRRVELTFLAGYLTTVAAGGGASLGLANDVAQTAPEISGWAYLIGGLGERITWTGGFSGLGRLVARELMRPFRLDDPPSVDFAADEAHVLVDKQLNDPLVHLQLKQTRIATAALFPGVNLQVPFVEPTSEPHRQPDSRRTVAPVLSAHALAAEDALQTIANVLTPMLLERLRDQLPTTPRERGSKSQRKLPLARDG